MPLMITFSCCVPYVNLQEVFRSHLSFPVCFSAAAQSEERERECASNDQHQQVDEQSVAGEPRENNTILCSKSSRCYGLWEKTHDGEIRLVKQGHKQTYIQYNM